MFGKHPKKTKDEDLSVPTEADMTVKPEDEIATLMFGSDGIQAVMPEKAAEKAQKKADPTPLEEALALVDALAVKCSDGHTAKLEEIRALRTAMAKIK